MGQDWEIIDLDSRERIGSGDELGSWFWHEDPGVMETLRTPQTDMKIDAMLQVIVADQRASLLLRLPADLFDPVIKELAGADNEDVYSVFCFAVTCKAVLSLSRKHIISHQREYIYSRAGHRVICVGEYAWNPSELPSGMLTAEEKQDLSHFEGRDGARRPALLEYAVACFPSYYPFYSPPRHHLSEVFDGPRSRTPSSWLPNDWTLVWSLGSVYYPKDRPWVLCNLTKREYVRNYRPVFWHFLLASICWSPVPAIDMSYANEADDNKPDHHQNDERDANAYDDNPGQKGKCPLTQGRWAGDRFAITLLEGLAAQGKGPWADKTDQVQGELVKRIWNAEAND